MQNIRLYSILKTIGFSLFLGGLLNLELQAQSGILDDTTSQIYGPETTEFYREDEVRDNRLREQVVDTSLNNFHRYLIKQQEANLYQNLGSFGSALRPIFFEPPREIGTRWGVNVYDPMTFQVDKVRYFNTRSPFTQTYYTQGTNGDQEIHFLFTRNINPRWNIGFHYARINANRQYGSEENEDRLIDDIRFVAFTSYQSENERYRVLYHYSHLNANNEETGGVEPNSDLPNDGIFSFREADAQLTQLVSSWQTQNFQHVYQEYKLDDAFTLYHSLDIQRQRERFSDRDLANNGDFYPQAQEPLFIEGQEVRVFNFNAEKTSEGSIYRRYENKIGIKGKLAKFNYRAYYKNRIFAVTTEYEDQVYRQLNADSSTASSRIIPKRINSGFENFLGGTLFYQFSDSSRLEADAEFLLGRDYRIQGRLYSKFFEASFLSQLYRPSLVQQEFISNHFFWDKSYSNTLVNRINGGIRLENKAKTLLFKPSVTYTTINNLVYFDSLAQPQQSSDFIQIFQASLRFDYKLGPFRHRNLAIFTANTGDDVLRIPDIFVNSQFYCENCLFRKLMQTQLGVELHYKSGYFADAYMPVSKQFYLQDFFFVEGYAIIDIFASFKIQNFRVFLKLAHANERPDQGFITAPIYPGMRRAFVFGVDWMFFK